MTCRSLHLKPDLQPPCLCHLQWGRALHTASRRSSGISTLILTRAVRSDEKVYYRSNRTKISNRSNRKSPKSSNGRKIARMARILRIFGRNRSPHRDLFFKNFANDRYRIDRLDRATARSIESIAGRRVDRGVAPTLWEGGVLPDVMALRSLRIRSHISSNEA